MEVKSEKEKTDEIDGENGAKALATRKWEGLNPDQLKYQMIFTSTDGVRADDMLEAQSFITQEKKRGS